MAVVGEDDDLAAPAVFGEQRQRAGGALVVEAGEDVVADERQRFSGAAFEQSQPQREKQLVAGAFAEALDADALALGLRIASYRIRADVALRVTRDRPELAAIAFLAARIIIRVFPVRTGGSRDARISRRALLYR